MYDERLSVAEHVAQRMMQRSQSSLQQNLPLVELLDQISNVFRRGRKLDAETFEAMAAQMRAVITATNPIRFNEYVRKPTRVRPNSGGVEMLVLTRSVEPGHGRRAYITTKRLLLTRKKAVLDMGWPGIVASQHLFERAVERCLVDGVDLDDVEHSIVDTIGLGVVWRHAYRTGRIRTDQIAMPMRGGLLLGVIERLEADACTRVRSLVNRDCRLDKELPDSRFQDGGDTGSSLSLNYSTVISDKMFWPAQVMLRDSLEIFMARYRTALDELARSICWEDAEIEPNRGFVEVEPALEILADNLTSILEANEDGLRRRRREETELIPESPPSDHDQNEKMTE